MSDKQNNRYTCALCHSNLIDKDGVLGRYFTIMVRQENGIPLSVYLCLECKEKLRNQLGGELKMSMGYKVEPKET